MSVPGECLSQSPQGGLHVSGGVVLCGLKQVLTALFPVCPDLAGLNGWPGPVCHLCPDLDARKLVAGHPVDGWQEGGGVKPHLCGKSG